MSTDQQLVSDKPISQTTIVTQVMARIKELIASGNYKPGDRLPTEQELATMFGVGRSSIREAIKVFQHLGVVESKAAKGTFVQDRANISLEAITWALLLGNDDIGDIYELREAIESIAFRRLAVKLEYGDPIVRKTVERLKNIVQNMTDAAAADDRDSLAEADYAFHQTIIEAGGNRLFLDVYHTLQAFMKNVIIHTYDNMPSLDQVATDHAEIISVLETQPVHVAVGRHWSHFRRSRRLFGLQNREEGENDEGADE